jgi:hypothetical protein
MRLTCSFSLHHLPLAVTLLLACGDDKGDDTTGVTSPATTGAPETTGDTGSDPTVAQTSGTTVTTTDAPDTTTTTTADPSSGGPDTTTSGAPDTTTSGDPGTTTTGAPDTTTGETTEATTGDATDGTTTKGGGLGEGEICQDMPDACAEGLKCCYPCGIPDCMNTCIKPDLMTGECPLFP